MQLYVNGDLAESRELLTAELERGHARGYLDHESFALMLLAELEVRAGRWQLADGYARQTLELTLGTDLWNAEAAGHWTCALVDAHLGRVGVRARARRDGAPAGDRRSATSGSRRAARTSSGSSRSRSATPRARSATSRRCEPTRRS